MFCKTLGVALERTETLWVCFGQQRNSPNRRIGCVTSSYLYPTVGLCVQKVPNVAKGIVFPETQDAKEGTHKLKFSPDVVYKPILTVADMLLARVKDQTVAFFEDYQSHTSLPLKCSGVVEKYAHWMYTHGKGIAVSGGIPYTDYESIALPQQSVEVKLQIAAQSSDFASSAGPSASDSLEKVFPFLEQAIVAVHDTAVSHTIALQCSFWPQCTAGSMPVCTHGIQKARLFSSHVPRFTVVMSFADDTGFSPPT